MSEDLISRQAAIDALGKEGLITAMIVVDNVPSAQSSDIAKDIAQIIKNELDMHELLKPAQRKKGKWIPVPNTRLVTCECGFTTDRLCKYNFCPDCGAEMEKGEYDE